MRISDWSSDVCSSDLPCLPINVIDPDRVARDLGFARQRIDFGLHQRERRQQRCPEVELPGGVTGEVEFSALLGERDQPRPCIATLLMWPAMVGGVGLERPRVFSLPGTAAKGRRP